MQKNIKRNSQVSTRSSIGSKTIKPCDKPPNLPEPKTIKKSKHVVTPRSDRGDQSKTEKQKNVTVDVPKSPKKLHNDDAFLVFRKGEVRCRNQQTQTGPPYEGHIARRRSLQSLIPRLVNSRGNKQDDLAAKEQKQAIDMLGKIFNARAEDNLASLFPPEEDRQHKLDILEKEYLKKYHDGQCEKGQVLLPESERRNTLTMLERSYNDCIKELNYLPLNSETDEIQNKKIQLERQIRHIQNGLDIFRKPMVYIKLDN